MDSKNWIHAFGQYNHKQLGPNLQGGDGFIKRPKNIDNNNIRISNICILNYFFIDDITFFIGAGMWNSYLVSDKGQVISWGDPSNNMLCRAYLVSRRRRKKGK